MYLELKEGAIRVIEKTAQWEALLTVYLLHKVFY
jgi:hypothetical protein